MTSSFTAWIALIGAIGILLVIDLLVFSAFGVAEAEIGRAHV